MVTQCSSETARLGALLLVSAALLLLAAGSLRGCDLQDQQTTAGTSTAGALQGYGYFDSCALQGNLLATLGWSSAGAWDSPAQWPAAATQQPPSDAAALQNVSL